VCGRGFIVDCHFEGNKSEVLACIENVDTAFSLISSNKEDILCKFVLTHIIGEPRMEIQTEKMKKCQNSDAGIAILCSSTVKLQ